MVEASAESEEVLGNGAVEATRRWDTTQSTTDFDDSPGGGYEAGSEDATFNTNMTNMQTMEFSSTAVFRSKKKGDEEDADGDEEEKTNNSIWSAESEWDKAEYASGTARYRTFGRMAELSLDTLRMKSRRSSGESEASLGGDSTLLDATHVGYRDFASEGTQSGRGGMAPNNIAASAKSNRLRSHRTADAATSSKAVIARISPSPRHNRSSSMGAGAHRYASYDERPIRSSGRYQIEQWDEVNEGKKSDPFGRATPVSLARTGTSEEEVYSDDWETDDSDRDAPKAQFIYDRYEDDLTPRGAERVRAGNEKDVRQVLAEIRRRAINGTSSGTVDSPLASRPWSSSSRTSRLGSNDSQGKEKGSSNQADGWRSIAARDRQRLQKTFGPEQFSLIYDFLKDAHSRPGTVNPKEKKRALERLVGKDNLQYCFEMDQLIFIEDTFLNNDGIF